MEWFLQATFELATAASLKPCPNLLLTTPSILRSDNRSLTAINLDLVVPNSKSMLEQRRRKEGATSEASDSHTEQPKPHWRKIFSRLRLSSKSTPGKELPASHTGNETYEDEEVVDCQATPCEDVQMAQRVMLSLHQRRRCPRCDLSWSYGTKPTRT
jgi:hypothetical protein